MKNVADYAQEFAKRAKAKEKPKAAVDYQYVEAFLGELSRLGFSFAKDCLQEIPDPELRKTVETLFLTTSAGAALGLVIGLGVEGIPVGGAIIAGAATGLVTGAVALVLVAQNDSTRGKLIVSVK